jgi:hypothetical protein
MCAAVRRFSHFFVIAITAVLAVSAGADSALVRSAKSGPWSAPDTWETGLAPPAGARVQVRAGHTVTYDVGSDQFIRSIHVAGTLTFAADRDTRLTVGLIKVQNGDDPTETGFDCPAHLGAHDSHGSADSAAPQASLLVGTADRPIDSGHTAVIRLTPVAGLDKDSYPALICCGGRMEFHGSPMNRTWVKLGAPANAGDVNISLAETVSGWRAGDRVILTATTRQNKERKTFLRSVRDRPLTEERIVASIEGSTVRLDRALQYDHLVKGEFRGEVANLSRNVVIESADPAGPATRGHVMYHRGSSAAVCYAEFRHLGKEGVLGRYSLHFHLADDSMRGSSVIGCSIWDSGNRWITVHGTNYLVVRDCVGYRSMGHGFFLEDGTEEFNVFDRNLAVEAFTAKPLPKQVLAYDKNDGSGFWWANSRNTFTRNVAAECDEYGYFFQVEPTEGFDPDMPVRQPDGTYKETDIRTLPFVRFEDNESHTQRRHAFNLGGSAPFGDGVAGVGPDEHHPFVIRNTRVWDVHWAFHPVSPGVLVDHMDIWLADYAVWRAVYLRHAYRQVSMEDIHVNKEFSPKGTKPDESRFPNSLSPVDDLPPTTVITSITHAAPGMLLVRGTTADNSTVKRVTVNGREAKAVAANFAQWEIELSGVPGGPVRLTARAEDAAGNVEPTPHVLLAP